MSNIKISELTEATEVYENDELVIVQNNTTKKIKAIKIGTGGAGGGDNEPVGTMKLWLSDVVPDNYLLADGQAVSRTNYPKLFEVLGTTYGEGDGSTTFNLPDMRDYVPVGKSDTDNNINELGKKYGEKTHALSVAEMPQHVHNLKTSSETGSHTDGFLHNGSYELTNETMSTMPVGDNQPHNNMQPSIALNFIIKAKSSAGVVAEVIQENETANETDVYSAQATQNIIKQNIITGEECPTNEWIDGKRVYCKRIDLGEFPNSTTKEIETGLDMDAITITRFYATGKSATKAQFCIPYITTTNNSANIGLALLATGNIRIECGSDRSAIVGHAYIYYYYDN